jgi:site-specific recombinase XerD
MYPGRAPWVGLRNQALIMCLATTPARVSALCRVLVTEVDFRTEEITFHDKGGVTYKAVLFPETARAIDRYKNARPFDVASLFVSDNGTQLTAQAVRQMMKRLKKALGITKPLYPHLFRHRFGMQTVLWNLSLDEAARAMGHRSTKATEIYRQWVSEDAAMAKIHRIVSARTA